MPPPLDTHYADGTAGLRALWNDILVAAQRDDRERVHRLMASLVMSDQELTTLFGEREARSLLPRYLPMISTLVNIGAMELVAQIAERKYDDIEVFTVDGSNGEDDRAILSSLRPKIPVYGVRVKRRGATRGLRYDFFVYLGDRASGRWVTGNQLGKYLNR